MNIIDISPTISNKTAVFPGDTSLSLLHHRDYKNGDSYALCSLNTTTHIGAHTDAPYHYHQEGETIEQRSLDYYYGPCQVMTVPTKPDPFRVVLNDIRDINIEALRVLFKTNSYTNAEQWQSEFTGLSPELIEYLARFNVKLIGIDTPSVDPAESKALETHQAIFKHDMAILEGIVLNDVPDGIYTLAAFPLKIAQGDASPVRAVLISE